MKVSLLVLGALLVSLTAAGAYPFSAEILHAIASIYDAVGVVQATAAIAVLLTLVSACTANGREQLAQAWANVHGLGRGKFLAVCKLVLRVLRLLGNITSVLLRWVLILLAVVLLAACLLPCLVDISMLVANVEQRHKCALILKAMTPKAIIPVAIILTAIISKATLWHLGRRSPCKSHSASKHAKTADIAQPMDNCELHGQLPLDHGEADPAISKSPLPQVSEDADVEQGNNQQLSGTPLKPEHDRVLSKAEKRRKKKQEKAAAKALTAQQQPASSAAAPSHPSSAPPVRPPTAPANPGLTSPGALPKQSASSAQSPQGGRSSSQPIGVPVVKPPSSSSQDASSITDLPSNAAASLIKAADRQLIKPANWVPQSYSAAVGPASFGADVVTPLVGHKAPIADLLKKYNGTPKHKQLNKLTKGSRPFTHYRSIRGDGDCGFRAILVAILLQACCCGPTVGASMAARMMALFSALPDWTCSPAVIAGYHTLKGLLHNPCGKSVKEVLSVCKQQRPSDDMVSLLRAITAKGFLDKATQYLPWVQDHTDCLGLPMDYICSECVLPLASTSTDGQSERRWAHEAHMFILAEVLGLKFTVHNVQKKLYPILAGDHQSERGVAFDLVLIGGHYDLLYRTGNSTAATRRVGVFGGQLGSVRSASGLSATAAVSSPQRSRSLQNEDGLEWDEPELESEVEPERVLVLPPPSHSRVKTADFFKSSTAVSQCPPAKYPEFAVIGRSNVGKSSLINMLTGKKALAQISKTPGKTKCINHFIINNSWFLVDLPGYGYAKRSKDLRLEWNDFTKDYLLNRETLANVLLLIDASIPPTQVDLECADWLAGSQVPFALVFTKLDKRKKGIPSPSENIDAFKEALMQEWEHLPFSLETSALKNTGRQELLSHIASLRVLWQQEH
ncbi:hypothetical protein WJX79_001978 [Trebouxia sp. C0005]